MGNNLAGYGFIGGNPGQGPAGKLRAGGRELHAAAVAGRAPAHALTLVSAAPSCAAARATAPWSLTGALASALSRAAGGDGVEALTTLLDAVKRLDWILQGHFGDEEDDLFVPALELLTPAQFAAMARQCEAIEASA